MWWLRSRWSRIAFTAVAVAGVVTVAVESWMPGRWAATLGVAAGALLAVVAARVSRQAED